MVRLKDNFTSKDLLQYTETLIRESKVRESRSSGSNYSWLQSKYISGQVSTGEDLEALKPLMRKMSPESCAAVAVKLDSLTGLLTNQILSTLKKVLEEKYSIQMFAENLRREKEINVKKVNRVQPAVLPGGRQSTVSFIFKE